MSRGTLRGYATRMSLAVAICVGFWALQRSVQAQEKKEEPAKNAKKVAAEQEKPAVAKKEAAQAGRMKRSTQAKKGKAQPTEEFQGPPKPGRRTPRTAKPAAKPKKGIPEPTVVLKPGEVPGIKFDQATFDFGRIRAGEDVQHDYWFENTGNGPLELLRVKPG